MSRFACGEQAYSVPMGETTDVADEPFLATGMAVPELLTFSLRRAAAVALSDLQGGLAQAKVRPIQFAILTVLGDRPGVRQSQLSPMLGIRRTNLVPLLSELEARGLCERRPVPGDRRAAALFLTDAGMAVREHCAREAALHEDRLCGRIGPNGREQLVALLHRLTDPTSDQPAPVPASANE